MFVPSAAAFLASMCIMIAELVAGRLISRHLGQSLYTWTSCIGVFLTGISVGNYLGGRLADRYPPRPALAVLFLISSVTCLLSPLLNRVIGDWTLLWELSWPLRIFLHVTLTFIAPAVLLGTIGPVVAKMALAESRQQTGATIGQVYAWGAVGSIVGTYLTGFYLVSAMGSVATLVAVAVLLAAAAAWFGGSAVRVARLWLVASLALAATLALPGGLPQGVAVALAFRDAPDDSVLFDAESRYSYVQVRAQDPERNDRIMVLDRLVHSIRDLRHPERLMYDYTWVYEAVIDRLAPAGRPVRTLVIGGGGFSFPSYLAATRPGSEVHVAEIDPVVTQAAREAFGLVDDPGLVVYDRDARQVTSDLLRRRRAGEAFEPFQFIMGDTVNDYAVPYHLTTREFATQVRDLLRPDGAYLLNMIDDLETGRFVGSMLRTCREVFPHVQVVAVDGQQQGRSTFVAICSVEPLPLDGLAEEIRARHPFRGMPLSAAEMDAVAARGQVLTDDHAPVDTLLLSSPGRQYDHTVDAFTRAGVEAARRGDLATARSLFERGSRFGGGTPLLLYNLALACANNGDAEGALQALRRTLERDPQNVDAHDLAGRLLAERGLMDDAVRHWEFVLRFDPDRTGALNNLGGAYLARGDYANAETTLRRLVAAHPDYADGYHNLALVSVQAGRLQDAIALYRQALDRDPNLAETHYNLAVLLAQQGDLAGAREHLQQAAALRPDVPQIRGALDQLPMP